MGVLVGVEVDKPVAMVQSAGLSGLLEGDKEDKEVVLPVGWPAGVTAVLAEAPTENLPPMPFSAVASESSSRGTDAPL